MKSVHNGCDLRGGEFLLPGVGVANCGRTGWGPLLWRRPGRGVCLLPGRAAWRTEPLPLGICSVFLLEVSLLSTGVPLPFVLLTTLKITAKTRPTSPGTVLCLVHSPPPPRPATHKVYSPHQAAIQHHVQHLGGPPACTWLSAVLACGASAPCPAPEKMSRGNLGLRVCSCICFNSRDTFEIYAVGNQCLTCQIK